MAEGLLLDVGGVIVRTPFEMMAPAERRLGLPDGQLGRRGPFDPDGDPDFDRVRDGTLSERQYWAGRAEHGAPLIGSDDDSWAFVRDLLDAPADEVLRSDTVALLDDALAAGIPVGILTNDLGDFHDEDWKRRMGVFDRIEVLVDGSVTGVLKPHPRAYRLASEAMGMPPESLVLLDDQPVNCDGARAVGMEAVELDPTDPGRAVDAVRAELGLR